jgi:hypothetical protein
MSLAAEFLHFASAPVHSIFFFFLVIIVVLFNFYAQMFNFTVLVLETSTAESILLTPVSTNAKVCFAIHASQS